MSNAVVVDTSLAIKWILEEPDSDKADTLLVEWSKKRKEILVPALLIYEIANALFQNVRNGEITLERAKEALAQLLRKKLKVDFPTVSAYKQHMTHTSLLLQSAKVANSGPPINECGEL